MTSIINPGQSMILGVGSVRGVFRPGADDQPVLRRELGMVLSADHRVLDGVTALQFLKRVVTALENPLSLLVA
jgi:pyruvate dehydrogenase E2 component (dihydrolipoamide acetyltransferase)